jgi:hypothetical protein
MVDKFDPSLLPETHQRIIREQLTEAAHSLKIHDPRKVKQFVDVMFPALSEDKYKDDLANGVFDSIEKPQETPVTMPEPPAMVTDLPEEHFDHIWYWCIQWAHKRGFWGVSEEKFGREAMAIYLKKNYKKDMESGTFFVDEPLTMPDELRLPAEQTEATEESEPASEEDTSEETDSGNENVIELPQPRPQVFVVKADQFIRRADQDSKIPDKKKDDINDILGI